MVRFSRGNPRIYLRKVLPFYCHHSAPLSSCPAPPAYIDFSRAVLYGMFCEEMSDRKEPPVKNSFVHQFSQNIKFKYSCFCNSDSKLGQWGCHRVSSVENVCNRSEGYWLRCRDHTLRR